MKRLLLALVIAMCIAPCLAGNLQNNWTEFYINISANSGAQTDYQVQFILDNRSGTSGYYSPVNKIFTDGWTRSDWADINATDSSGTPLPFWIENNTQTLYNVTAWVKVPAISVDNTTKIRWYYGNSSQTVSTMNGNNTFVVFSDFLGSSVDSYLDSSGSPAVSGGVCTLTGTAEESVWSKGTYGLNYTLKAKGDIEEAYYGVIGFETTQTYSSVPYAQYTMYGSGFMAFTYNTGSKQIAITYPSATDNLFEIVRNGATSVKYNLNGTLEETSTTQVPPGNLYVGALQKDVDGSIALDWITLRKSTTTEPTITRITESTDTEVSVPVASFVCAPTNMTLGDTLHCTDLSANATSWYWEFGDGDTSTDQHPTHVYATENIFDVNLKAENSAGSDWENKTSYVTTSTGLTADFGYVIDPIDTLNVTFTDVSTGHPTGWSWYFGDENYENTSWRVDADPWPAELIVQQNSYGITTLPNGTIIAVGGLLSEICGSSWCAFNLTYVSYDNGKSFSILSNNTGWVARQVPNVKSSKNGVLVMTGGMHASNPDITYNDTWVSRDYGVTWSASNISSGWSPRLYHAVVPMHDGSMVLIGGINGWLGAHTLYNDTWRTTDEGVTWNLMSTSPGWMARAGLSAIVTENDTIIITGGTFNGTTVGALNDTWGSTDYGATWVPINTSSEYPKRYNQGLSVIPDRSLLVGGYQGWSGFGSVSEGYRSNDDGNVWSLVSNWSDATAISVSWNDRWVTKPDGSVMFTYATETETLDTAKAITKNSTHRYDRAGTYEVTLQVYNTSSPGAGVMDAPDLIHRTITVYENTSLGDTDPIAIAGTPKDVKFHIQSFWGAPIADTNVTVQGVTTTTGNWDWLVLLSGIDLDETPINSTLMYGLTDINGDVVFLMVDSIKYNITVTASGYTFPLTYISPQASQYTISANMNESWFSAGNDTLKEVNVSVSWVTKNATHAFVNITYQDDTGTTTGGDVKVYQRSAGRAVNASPIAVMNVTASSCSNSTVVEVPTGGASYVVDVNATTSTGTNIKRTFAHDFKGQPVNLPGFTPETQLWLAMFILIFTAAFAGVLHAPQMSIVLCVELWAFWAIRWFDHLIDGNGYTEAVLVTMFILATFAAFVWNITEGKSKGKRSS